MKYFSLSELNKIAKDFGDQSLQENRDNFIRSIDSDPSLFSNLGSDFKEFLKSLNEASIVFLQWVEQNKDLNALLQGDKPTNEFKDEHSWLSHTLGKDFKNFLSPFLSKVALKFRDEKDIRVLRNLYSFLVLLSDDDRLVVEQELFKGIKEQISFELKATGTLNSENQLLAVSEKVCSDDIVAIIGYLSRPSYHTKVWFVDQILTILNNESCTARLAYRITQRLKNLELNPEHRQTIEEIEKDLKTGQLLNPNKKIAFFKRIRPSSIISVFLIIVSVISLYFVFNYKPRKEQPADLELASSFEQFSKEERRQLDSLIRSQRSSTIIDIPEQDQYFSTGTGVTLAIRNALRNEKMETLYNDWLQNAYLHDSGLIDSCEASTPLFKNRYSGVLSTDDLKGQYKTHIRNESIYSVYVFIFDNVQNGKIYSKIISPWQKTTLNLEKDQYLLFIAGKQLVEFEAPSGLAADEKPSQLFDHHFCQTDANLSYSLSTLYKLAIPRKAGSKLLLSGDEISSFIVGDLYGVLETN